MIGITKLAFSTIGMMGIACNHIDQVVLQRPFLPLVSKQRFRFQHSFRVHLGKGLKFIMQRNQILLLAQTAVALDMRDYWAIAGTADICHRLRNQKEWTVRPELNEHMICSVQCRHKPCLQQFYRSGCV